MSNIQAEINLKNFISRSVLAAFNNSASGNSTYISSFLSSKPPEEDLFKIRKEIKYLMISIVVFQAYSKEVEKLNTADAEFIELAKETKNMIDTLVEDAFESSPLELKLSYDEFADRYEKYNYLLYENKLEDIRRSFILGFTYQLKGVFKVDSDDTAVDAEDFISVGKWIYDTWGKIFGEIPQN